MQIIKNNPEYPINEGEGRRENNEKLGRIF